MPSPGSSPTASSGAAWPPDAASWSTSTTSGRRRSPPWKRCMPREVLAVLVAFGPAHLDDALDALRRVASRLCPGASLKGVVVDNALGGNLEIEVDAAFTRVSGDNSSREFSGWD